MKASAWKSSTDQSEDYKNSMCASPGMLIQDGNDAGAEYAGEASTRRRRSRNRIGLRAHHRLRHLYSRCNRILGPKQNRVGGRFLGDLFSPLTSPPMSDVLLQHEIPPDLTVGVKEMMLVGHLVLVCVHADHVKTRGSHIGKRYQGRRGRYLRSTGDLLPLALPRSPRVRPFLN